MKVTCLVLVTLFTLFLYYKAEANDTDSLRQILIQTQDSQERAALQYALAKATISTDWDASLALAREYKALALELQDESMIAKANFLIAYIYDIDDQHEEAVVHYFATVDRYRLLGDQEMVSYTLKNLGAIYYQTYSYQIAKDLYEECLRIDQDLSDMPVLAALYIRLGKVTASLGEYEQSLAYFQQALNIYRYLKEPLDVAETYNELGIVEYQREHHEEAIVAYELALESALGQEHQQRLQAKVLNNLGRAYKDLHDLNNSRIYFEQAMKLQEAIGARSFIVTTLNNIAEIAADQGDDVVAIGHFRKALLLAGEAKAGKEYVKAASMLHQLYKKHSKYDSALFYSEMVNASTMQVLEVKDKLERHNQRFRVDKLMADYLARKEQEVQATREQQQWLIFGLAFLLLSALSYYFYRKSRQRKLALREFNEELAAIARQLTDSIRQQSQ